MLRRLNKRIKGQNTAEYAILIGLVIAAAIGMQMYAKRTFQARVYDTSRWMTGYSNIGNLDEFQYEPYYQNSEYGVTRDTKQTGDLSPTGTFAGRTNALTERALGGYQEFGVINAD